MKRFICILFALPLLLASCAAVPSPLAYQDGTERAVCTLAVDGGTYKIEIIPGEALKITEPEELSGVAFSISDGRYTLSSGGITLELPDSLIPLITPVVCAFSLPADGAKTSTSGDDTRVVKVSANGGDYEIKLSADGAPAEISYKGVRGFVMYGITLTADVGE